MHWGTRMTGDKDDMTWLDREFARARDAVPVPSETLMARIAADADAQLHLREARTPAQGPRRRWRLALEGLGGWPAMTALAASAAVGVWLGAYATPMLGTPGVALADPRDSLALLDASAELALGLYEGEL